MSECVNLRQMNSTFQNLQVVEGTFDHDTSPQNGTLNINLIHVELTEEPLADRYRFRYENEARNAGPIKGVNSTREHTTYPTITIRGYRGPAWIYVSLITIYGPPYYPHPHKLVGEDCKDGIFRKLINVTEMPYCFSDLRIQCVKKKQVEESLKERERRRIDPFGTGFSHSSNLNMINFNAVRLCFQVISPGSNGNFYNPVLLSPVISKPIYDSKSDSNMAIMKLSHCSASVKGKEEIILLCGQVNKDDIEIIFYEEKDNEIIWEDYGEFSPHDVHHKVAISFKTPAYKTQNVREEINCFIYLRRPSDGTMGKPRKFTLRPIRKDPEGVDYKRRKYDDPSTRRDFQPNNICLAKPVYPTPRIIQCAVRKDAAHNNVESTSNAIQNTHRKEITYDNVESNPRAIQDTLRKEVTYDDGTVNKFHLKCNPGTPINPLPSVSIIGKDSYVQNGPLVCYNPVKRASTASQDQFVGALSLDMSTNTQQHFDHVYPAESEKNQLNKATVFEDPPENDKLKMLSKDGDPNQNTSNENASSISLDTDDVIIGFKTIFEFINGEIIDENMSFENNVGLLPNSDAGDDADDCLNRLSSLSLESNSKELDIDMGDVAKHSFSNAVGFSILVSS